MGSYDAGTFNWMPGGVFMNSPQFLEKLGDLYLERGIKPEVEIFDAGMLGIADYFCKTGPPVYPLPLSALPGRAGRYACHGGKSGISGAPSAGERHLVGLWRGKSTCPSCMRPWPWADIVRVGLEDNVYLSKGVPATNVQLVERAVQAVRTFGKQPATPAQAREILGLKPLK